MGCARRRVGNAWFGRSRLHAAERAEERRALGPHSLPKASPLGRPLAARPGLQPTFAQSSPRADLEPAGWAWAATASACVPAPASLLSPSPSYSWALSRRAPCSALRRSSLGFACSPMGQELTPPAQQEALQAVQTRLVERFLGFGPGLGLHPPTFSAPLPSLCPKPLWRLLRLPVPLGPPAAPDLPRWPLDSFNLRPPRPFPFLPPSSATS